MPRRSDPETYRDVTTILRVKIGTRDECFVESLRGPELYKELKRCPGMWSGSEEMVQRMIVAVSKVLQLYVCIVLQDPSSNAH